MVRSRIENYLGFPTGISGQEMAARAYHQAQKFGAEILITKATQLICNHRPYLIEVENGFRISARTVMIATGAQYRKLPLQNLSALKAGRLLWRNICGSAVMWQRRGSDCSWRRELRWPGCRVFSAYDKACTYVS